MSSLFDRMKTRFARMKAKLDEAQKNIRFSRSNEIRRTVIINGRVIEETKRDLSPEEEKKILDEADLMFANVSKKMEETVGEMEKGLDKIFKIL